MKKFLTYLFAFVIFFSLTYALGWMLILHSFTKSINRQYADQYFSAKNLGFPDEYYVKFTEVSPVGFPFMIAVKIVGWQEEGESNLFECKSPIYIGYDLIKQRIFLSYSGEALSRYKPINAGFGSRLKIDDYNVAVGLPLTSHLIGTVFTKERSWFELINFMHSFAVTSGNVKINDLVDGRLLYELEGQNTTISFEKQKHYTSLQDFQDNIPQRWDVLSHNKVAYSKFEGKQIIPISIFYSFWKTFLLSGESRFYIKTGANKMQDFATDMEIGVDYAHSSSNVHNAKSTLFYKGKINGEIADIRLKGTSNFALKEGFFDSLLELSGYLVSFSSGSPFGLGKMIANELEYIKDNKEKFSFKELENREYNFEVDMDLNTNNQSALFNVRRLSVISGNTGIGIINNTDMRSRLRWHIAGDLAWGIEGDVIMNNYHKLIELGINNLYNIGQFKSIPTKTRELHAAIARNFLTSISDHPRSTSPDLSFAYKLGSENISKGKVGSIVVEHLKPMYIFALYKTAAENIPGNEDIIGMIRQVDPELANDDQVMERLQELRRLEQQSLPSGEEVKTDTWEQLVK